MSAPVLTQAEVADLTAKAKHHVDMQTATKRWADLWPIVEVFCRRGTAADIIDAVEFLIEEGKVDESDRQAARIAFRKVRAKKRQEANQAEINRIAAT